MQDTIQTKAEDFLKDFENQYKLYKVDVVSEHGHVIEPIS